MLRGVGVLLVLGGCFYFGRAQVRAINRRVNALSSILRALEIIEQELVFHLSTMEELFEFAALRSSEPASGFLRMCGKELKKDYGKPLSEIWRVAALGKLTDLKKNEMDCLLALGNVLGRYDGEGQRKSIENTRVILAQAMSTAVRERQSQGKMYSVLGAAAGAFLVILLL